MSWNDKYDKINTDNEGYLIVFGGHYNTRMCKLIIEETNYDDPDEYDIKGTQNIYIKFGLVNFDGEVTNGWSEHDDYKKGRIKATRVVEQKHLDLINKIKKNNALSEERSSEVKNG